MCKSPVFLSDLLLLRDLFAPDHEKLVVSDQRNCLTGIHNQKFSLCKDIPSVSAFQTIFADLESHDTIVFAESSREKTIKLYYINNPDGTMRWIFPADEKDTGYLSLYNSGTWKARVYRHISKLAWSLGQQRHLVSGMISLQENLYDDLKTRFGIQSGESISFFTGTRGETRKVVMEIHSGKEVTDFIKIPLTASAARLVKQEDEMLKSLGRYDLTSLSLPRISAKVNGCTRLSNVKPALVIPADRINAIHLRAQAELYAISHERKAITDTAAWKVISSDMDALKKEISFSNGLDSRKMKHITQLLQSLFSSLNAGESVPVSVSHGDFTPWNMYCDEQRLYVYDWEMARNGIPMFFDLFHFSFQSGILQRRVDYKTVKEEIRTWTITPLAQQLINKYKVNSSLHLRLYLLFTVSRYLRQYIDEKELLEQSHWMIEAWTSALEDMALHQDKASGQ